jgi:hypothetical protein
MQHEWALKIPALSILGHITTAFYSFCPSQKSSNQKKNELPGPKQFIIIQKKGEKNVRIHDNVKSKTQSRPGAKWRHCVTRMHTRPAVQHRDVLQTRRRAVGKLDAWPFILPLRRGFGHIRYFCEKKRKKNRYMEWNG